MPVWAGRACFGKSLSIEGDQTCPVSQPKEEFSSRKMMELLGWTLRPFQLGSPDGSRWMVAHSLIPTWCGEREVPCPECAQGHLSVPANWNNSLCLLALWDCYEAERRARSQHSVGCNLLHRGGPVSAGMRLEVTQEACLRRSPLFASLCLLS